MHPGASLLRARGDSLGRLRHTKAQGLFAKAFRPYMYVGGDGDATEVAGIGCSGYAKSVTCQERGRR